MNSSAVSVGHRNPSIFMEFTESELTGLLELSRPLRYPKDAVIFNQGEPGDTLYLIRTGRVRVRRTDNEGKELILADLGPGEIFGEIAVMNHSERSAQAVAISDLLLASLHQRQFYDTLIKRPELALKIISLLCRRLYQTDGQLESVAYGTVKERLKTLLNGMRDNGIIQIGMTHQQLAAKIGASRESVTRALQNLREEGWEIVNYRK
jgi:CRP/FNR family cyclic AMP-dependent transcriptional regulator